MMIGKKQIIATLLILIVGIFIGKVIFSSEASQPDIHEHESSSETVWTCSMHPQIKLSQPGLCPICAMDLIPLEEGGVADDSVSITLSKNATERAKLETNVVKKRSLEQNLDLYGVVEVDESNLEQISSRLAGRIEKLDVDYRGATVKRGDPLYTMYSPQLLTLQQELIGSSRRAKGGNSFDNRVFEASKRKLHLLGFGKRAIEKIIRLQKPSDRLTVRSLTSGTVLALYVVEGGYLKEGSPVVRIANLNSVWLQAEAYERDLPFIKVGDSTFFHTESNPSEEFGGVVSFIDPLIDVQKRTAKVRIALKNSGLKLGAFGRVRIISKTDALLSIPHSAALYTGKRALVYVVEKGEKSSRYKGREVVLGKRGLFYTEVVSGLKKGEEVVSRGAFRIDGELQIMAKKSVMSIMDEPKRSSSTLSPSFIKAKKELFTLYFLFAKSLASDDAEGGKDHLHKIHSLLKRDIQFEGSSFALWNEEVKRLGDELHTKQFENMKGYREFLYPLSNALVALSKVYGSEEVYFVAHCPMAFDNRGAHWLQKDDDLKNPYYGAMMLKCGTIQGRVGE